MCMDLAFDPTVCGLEVVDLSFSHFTAWHSSAHDASIPVSLKKKASKNHVTGPVRGYCLDHLLTEEPRHHSVSAPPRIHLRKQTFSFGVRADPRCLTCTQLEESPIRRNHIMAEYSGCNW